MNSLIKLFRTVNRSTPLGLKTLSVPQQRFIKMSANASISQIQREKDIFQDVFPSIMDTIVTSTKFTDVPEVANWIKKVLEYNLQGGKKTRGLITTFTYESVEDPQNITEESLKISRVVGWCVEMLHAYFLVMDDIMDGSTKRRGVPCWYKLPNIGLGAINDAILIQACIYEVMNMYCKHMPQYTHIMNLLNEVDGHPIIFDIIDAKVWTDGCFLLNHARTAEWLLMKLYRNIANKYLRALLYTSVGQHLDFTMAHRNRNDYSMFTLERYSSIVKYKTSYYTLKLPVCLGLALANKLEQETHKQAEKICFEIGHLFQMQDDFIDCFGVEKVTGKIGTDIQEGKCSWLAVQALQRCNDKQRKVFAACYGSSEPAHMERIKRLYEELNLPRIYREEEKARNDAVIRHVQQFPSDKISPDLFLKLLNMIYDRQK